MANRNFFTSFIITFAFIILSMLTSCGAPTPFSSTMLNSKALTTFSINGSAGVISNNDIQVTLPYGSNLDNLVATFTNTGQSVTVNNVVQVSGKTANNFALPVSYTVTALNGTTRNYTVTVTVSASDAKAITTFSLTDTSAKLTVTGTITGNNITVVMPYGISLNNLIANFTTTGQNVIVNNIGQVSGQTSNNFSSPLTYVVTAADNTTNDYVVTVTNSKSDAKAITYFALDGNPGTINNTSINVSLPVGTDLADLTETFTINGSSLSVNGVTQESNSVITYFDQQAANPSVTYVVTAADGSTLAYNITIVYPKSYVTNAGNNSYAQCFIDNSLDLTNCNILTPKTNNGVDLLTVPSVMVMNNAFAYILNNAGVITNCAVDYQGNLYNCSNTSTILANSTGMTLFANYIYLMNTESYSQCTTNESGSASNCQTFNNAASPKALAINNNLAYFTNDNGSAYSLCQVNSGLISNCNIESGATNLGAEAINFYNNHAYIISQENSTCSLCNLDAATGKLTECHHTLGTNNAYLSGPSTITFAFGYAYIPNIGDNSYAKCLVNQFTGELINCHKITNNNFDQPSGMALQNF